MPEARRDGVDNLLGLLKAVPDVAFANPATAKLVAGMTRDTFVTLYDMMTDRKRAGVMPMISPVAPPMPAPPPFSSSSDPKPLDEFEQQCLVSLKRVDEMLSLVVNGMDIGFKPNEAAVILVEVIGKVASDIHWKLEIRHAAIKMLLTHIGWDTTTSPVTADRMKAYELLMAIYASDPSWGGWPWIEQPAAEE